MFYIFRGRKIYEPPRYMTVAQAASQIVEIIQEKKKDSDVTLGMIERVSL